MNWVDWVLAVVLFFSIMSGLKAGFARVGIGTVASFIGILAGLWCYGVVGAYVLDYVNSRQIANLVGFFIVFFAFVILGSILGAALAEIFKWIGLSWMDRLLGGAFGAIRGVLVVVAFMTVFLAFAPDPVPRSVTESKFLPYVMDASNILSYATPREIKDAFRDTKDKVRRVWDEHKPSLDRPSADKPEPGKLMRHTV